MSAAIRSLILAAHKAEHLAGIYDNAGEEVAAHQERLNAEEIRHGIELLTTDRQAWEIKVAEEVAARGLQITGDQFAEIGEAYTDNLNPGEAVQAWWEDQPVNDP